MHISKIGSNNLCTHTSRSYIIFKASLFTTMFLIFTKTKQGGRGGRAGSPPVIYLKGNLCKCTIKFPSCCSQYHIRPFVPQPTPCVLRQKNKIAKVEFSINYYKFHSCFSSIAAAWQWTEERTETRRHAEQRLCEKKHMENNYLPHSDQVPCSELTGPNFQ